MDPLSAIGLGIGQIAGLVGNVLARQESANTRGERIEDFLNRPQDRTQVYILGGVGLVVLILLIVLVRKK